MANANTQRRTVASHLTPKQIMELGEGARTAVIFEMYCSSPLKSSYKDFNDYLDCVMMALKDEASKEI